jgi:hypothetical protein
MSKKTVAFWLCWLGLPLLLGCGGSGLETVPVTGTVTYNGQPLADAAVAFQPADGRAATGITDASGKFTLTTLEDGDGAIVGEHTVTVSPGAGQTAAMPGVDAPVGATQKSAIPDRYSNPGMSGLKASVTADGPNDFTFDLTK